MKLKIAPKPALEKIIKHYAKHLGLYDPRFTDPSSQSGGYYGFRHLCLTAEELPESVESMFANQDMIVTPVIAAMQRLHPLIRERALKVAKLIRNPKKS